MDFVEDKFIPSGFYNIINAKHWDHQSIIPSDDDEKRLRASPSNDDMVSDLLDFQFLGYNVLYILIQWSIVLLTNKKWQIRSHPSGECPDVESELKEGEEILLWPAQKKPHSWAIKQCQTPGFYLLARICFRVLLSVLISFYAESILPYNLDCS
jgi:hypothetical protein